MPRRVRPVGHDDRRYAMVAIAVLAALLPTLGPLRLIPEMIPLIALYELSILLAAALARPAPRPPPRYLRGRTDLIWSATRRAPGADPKAHQEDLVPDASDRVRRRTPNPGAVNTQAFLRPIPAAAGLGQRAGGLVEKVWVDRVLEEEQLD